MVFTADLGNSSITLAVFDKGGTMAFRSSISSTTNRSEDEYVLLLRGIFSFYDMDPSIVEGGIISSVVPPMTNVFIRAVAKLLGRRPLLVGPGIKTGLDIKIDHHSQLGSDLVATTVAATAHYAKPFIIIDMGTATTVTAVNEKSELCGVIIMPGVRIALDALSSRTAELPYISIDSPAALLGKNTVDAMQSGIVYGTACALDGLIDRLSDALNTADISILITGGLAYCIIPHLRHEINHAPNLILEGLYILYVKNQKKHKPV